MPISLHAASIPVLTHALKALSALLEKAEAHATALRIEPNALLQARLFPDMFPLTRQVQIACDMTKGAACRLAQMDIPAHPDTEASFQELQARITKVLDLLASIPATAIDGGEDRTITIKVAGQEMHFKAANYLLSWVNPNVFFHITTAYNILRHNGVPLGKGDYLGRV